MNGTAGLFSLPPRTTMNGLNYVDLLKDKLKYTWPFINARFLCKMVHHAIGPKLYLSS